MNLKRCVVLSVLGPYVDGSVSRKRTEFSLVCRTGYQCDGLYLVRVKQHLVEHHRHIVNNAYHIGRSSQTETCLIVAHISVCDSGESIREHISGQFLDIETRYGSGKRIAQICCRIRLYIFLTDLTDSEVVTVCADSLAPREVHQGVVLTIGGNTRQADKSQY